MTALIPDSSPVIFNNSDNIHTINNLLQEVGASNGHKYLEINLKDSTVSITDDKSKASPMENVVKLIEIVCNEVLDKTDRNTVSAFKESVETLSGSALQLNLSKKKLESLSPEKKMEVEHKLEMNKIFKDVLGHIDARLAGYDETVVQKTEYKIVDDQHVPRKDRLSKTSKEVRTTMNYSTYMQKVLPEPTPPAITRIKTPNSYALYNLAKETPLDKDQISIAFAKTLAAHLNIKMTDITMKDLENIALFNGVCKKFDEFLEEISSKLISGEITLEKAHGIVDDFLDQFEEYLGEHNTHPKTYTREEFREIAGFLIPDPDEDAEPQFPQDEFFQLDRGGELLYMYNGGEWMEETDQDGVVQNPQEAEICVIRDEDQAKEIHTQLARIDESPPFKTVLKNFYTQIESENK